MSRTRLTPTPHPTPMLWLRLRLTCTRRAHRLHPALAALGLMCVAPATMRAQATAEGQAATARADSLSGKWQARGRNPAYGGNLLMIMTLVQRGDSVAG